MPKKSKKQIEDEIRIEEENKNFTAHEAINSLNEDARRDFKSIMCD